jgi:hypothetical protein
MMMTAERGGIVTGWLFKLILSLAVFGVVAFEVGAIVVAKATIENTAGDALAEAVDAYRPSGDLDLAEKAALAEVERKGAVLEAFRYDSATTEIIITVSKKAKTLFLHRIGFAEDWAISRATQRRPAG